MVSFLGTKSDLAKFKKTLSADKIPVGSHNEDDQELDTFEDEENIDDEGPSTSTTPSKASDAQFEVPVRHTPVKHSPVLSLTPMKKTSLSPGLDDSGFMESTPQSSKSSRSLDFTCELSVTQNESEN